MTYEARSVTVRAGSATLLSDVTLELRPGEIVALAGPNGAGKSTLVRAFAGDLAPASGSVGLDARPLSSWSRPQLARRRAVMGPGSEVAFSYSAREVALLGRLPLHGGDPDAADLAIVASLLEAVDCTHLAERVFHTLSTGERQRVSLARAIAQVSDALELRSHDTAVDRYLLLDEPTSSLDPAHRHVAMRLLRREARAGRGVLAVLHDLDLVAAYADRIALLRAGRLLDVGPPAHVLRPELLEAAFDIPMLVLPHPHRAHALVIAEPRAEEP